MGKQKKGKGKYTWRKRKKKKKNEELLGCWRGYNADVVTSVTSF